MSFNDIRRISYDRLTQRVATEAPYKGSGNAYPLGERRYSDRHFRKESDGTFSVWYADRELVDNKFGRSNDKSTIWANANRGYYERRLLGRVHPDNTYEFVNHSWPGENMMLSQALCAYLHHDQSKGGTVYEKKLFNKQVVHPVFKGLRINCDTGEAVTPYSAFLPKVNRKAANEVMSKYKEFITVFQTMINTMDDRGIWEVYEDLYKIEAENDKEVWRNMDVTTVKRLIDEKKYVDAGCLFAMFTRATHMRWRVERCAGGDNYQLNQPLGYEWRTSAMKAIDTDFRKMILKQHPDVFSHHELEQGAPLPSSQWGVEVRAEGHVVKRL